MSGIGGPPPVAPTVEIEELAALLAEVVELAGSGAVYPSRLAVIAELARDHDSVRRAMRGER